MGSLKRMAVLCGFTVLFAATAQAEDWQVAKDEELIVLEAMKMESPICAPCAGTVAAILVKESDSVNEGQVLVQLS